MKKALLGLLALLSMVLVACSAPANLGNDVVGIRLVQSEQQRDTSPGVSQGDLSTLVDGNNAFAFDLFQVLRSEPGNLFFSPYSISEALAMTFAGARGDTERQMAAALQFNLAQARLHPAFNQLDLLLKQRGQGAKGKDDQPFRLQVVNAIWGQAGFPFLPAYLDTLALSYGAGMRTVDFVKQTEAARLAINRWVSEQTEDRIKELVPSGAINDLTRLVLTNAIYFKAAWEYQFDKNNTANAPFYRLDGSQVTVPTMNQTEWFGYAAGNGYQAIELPYDGRELSMVVLLPDAGQYAAFEKSLTAGTVKDIINSLTNKRIELSMPKFQYDSSFGLKPALTSLGMGAAFTDGADFSGMDGRKDLLIQDVLHKAFVSVDENGTEAAAATAVIVGLTSMPPEAVAMKLDHPFIYLIRDIATGQVLFVGRVLDPSASS